MPSYLQATREGVEILLHVQPGAARNRVVGEHGGRLKLQISSPPVAGAANDEVLAFLAECLVLPRRQLQLLHGKTGRRKLVRVAGLALEEVAARLVTATVQLPGSSAG